MLAVPFVDLIYPLPPTPVLVSNTVEQGAGQETENWYIDVRVHMKPGGGEPDRHNSIMHGIRYDTEEEARKDSNLKAFLERLRTIFIDPQEEDSDHARWVFHNLYFGGGGREFQQYKRDGIDTLKRYSNRIRKVAAIGAGSMGTAVIAELAFSKVSISVYDHDADVLGKLKPKLQNELTALRFGLFKKDIPEIMEKIEICSSPEQAIKDADLVLEMGPADIEMKKAINRMIDRNCKRDAILVVTNNQDDVGVADAQSARKGRRKGEAVEEVSTGEDKWSHLEAKGLGKLYWKNERTGKCSWVKPPEVANTIMLQILEGPHKGLKVKPELNDELDSNYNPQPTVITIGRNASHTVGLPKDGSLSLNHAKLQLSTDDAGLFSATLFDTASTNGVYINGKKVDQPLPNASAQVRPGDIVKMGDTQWAYKLEPTFGEGTWWCTACTLDNEPGHQVCAACGSAAPAIHPQEHINSCVRHPENMIGMRFMRPVFLINHVEVTRAKATSSRTWARVVAWLQEIGKLPFQGGHTLLPLDEQQVNKLQSRGVTQKIQAQIDSQRKMADERSAWKFVDDMKGDDEELQRAIEETRRDSVLCQEAKEADQQAFREALMLSAAAADEQPQKNMDGCDELAKAVEKQSRKKTAASGGGGGGSDTKAAFENKASNIAVETVDATGNIMSPSGAAAEARRRSGVPVVLPQASESMPNVQVTTNTSPGINTNSAFSDHMYTLTTPPENTGKRTSPVARGGAAIMRS
jgi:hypothetical protein